MKKWCEHMKWIENDVTTGFDKNQYVGWYSFPGEGRFEGTFLHVGKDWKFCPHCSAPRPVDKKVELPCSFVRHDFLDMAEKLSRVIEYLKSAPWEK